MPIFLLLVGVVLDLGWYYLNVSRLQNAADAAAVALLTKKNSNTPSTPDMPTKPIVLSETADEELIKNLTTLRNDNVIVGNWEVQYLYSQNKDDTITVEKNGEKYTINYTDANGNKIYKESEVDSLDVDFKWEVRFNQDSQYVIRAKDWDFTLDNAYAEVNTNAVSSMSNIDYVMKFDNGELNPALFMRIHATLNFDEPHKARVSYQYDDPDILWVRIESEPMYSEPDLYRENDDTKQKQNEKSYVDEAKRASSSKFSTSTNRITTRPRKNIAPLSFSTAAPKDTTPPTPYANQDPLS